jgi:hypothetical protein
MNIRLTETANDDTCLSNKEGKRIIAAKGRLKPS